MALNFFAAVKKLVSPSYAYHIQNYSRHCFFPREMKRKLEIDILEGRERTSLCLRKRERERKELWTWEGKRSLQGKQFFEIGHQRKLIPF